MFNLKNISKKYGENIALDNVSLSINSGMNFIIGASGSGKSTLLKIMSGFDDDYSGEVYLYGKNIKELKSKEKSYLYNNTFGFIWQDFNLLEDCTVLDNILLPVQLKSTVDRKQAEQLLCDLKLKNVVNKQVKYLSGGQKQRVAIARELMKNPKIILADEPTSALDKQTSKDIMKILREISKTRTVIVVTHDTSHILPKDTVFELDKGELISASNTGEDFREQSVSLEKTVLPFKHIFSIMKTNISGHKGRFLISALSLMIGVCFLLTTATDSIQSTSNSAFDEVFDMYGDSVLDISLYHSFMGASGTSNEDSDSPNVDVDQNVNGIYEKYQNDDRIEFITYVEPFDNITIDDSGKTYSIQRSGNVPVINHIIAGRMGTGSGNEIVVPESLVKNMGITAEEALGKEITFHGEVTEWHGETPSFKPVSVNAEIVGVIDSTMITNYEGQKYEYSIDDSFFFSKSALTELLGQTEKDTQNLNVLMRVKTPEDLIAIKDELNKEGLVPTGYFEIIEDLVRLNSQSSEQSSSANIFIIALVLVMVSAISLITSMLRKKEYAIFKVSGFSNGNLRKLNLFEAFLQMVFSCTIAIILSPIINIASNKIFKTPILSFENIGITILLFAGVTILSYIITEIICETTSILKTFKTGER
ncbi:MAG: ABC transporter ATP-binding protein/permease [Clostridiales bacterium]|nr:ABC transporter ATP-binding protein/permease [Clostridiales bacterium]